jgi:hypothetical protein
MAYVNPDNSITNEEAYAIDGYVQTIAEVREAIMKPMSAKSIAEMLETIVGNEPDKLNDLYLEISKLPSFRQWYQVLYEARLR